MGRYYLSLEAVFLSAGVQRYSWADWKLLVAGSKPTAPMVRGQVNISYPTCALLEVVLIRAPNSSSFENKVCSFIHSFYSSMTRFFRRLTLLIGPAAIMQNDQFFNIVNGAYIQKLVLVRIFIEIHYFYWWFFCVFFVRTSLKENKDLKAASVVLKNLLLSQKEEYDKLQKVRAVTFAFCP